MYGRLPKSITLSNNVEYKIRSDFRDCLNILIACDDPDLSRNEKFTVLMKIFYVDYDTIPREYLENALEKANWFLNGGGEQSSDDNKRIHNNKKIYDWEQDEQLIFGAINKVAGKEVRDVEYMHFWTFLAYFNEIGEGLFSTVLNIRQKKANNKKLEKYEKEFYEKNKDLIDIKSKYSEEQQEEINFINNLLG